MLVALLYPLLTAALYYLGTRAKVTSWLWSRYPAWLGGFMDCAACTGFWYGLATEAAIGAWQPHVDFAPIVIGLCSIVWTPVVAALMQHSLFTLGSAITITDVSPSDESAANGSE